MKKRSNKQTKKNESTQLKRKKGRLNNTDKDKNYPYKIIVFN